jgi:hypothetical protein
MATELTWVTDANRAVASAASAAEQSKWELWYLLASLCGNSNLAFNGNAGVWSVVRTCGSTDGTAGNLTADATDRLHLSSGAYTSNDWVFGANTTGGTGRSWELIQSPSGIGSYDMLVDFGNAVNGKCDITIGKTLSGNGTTTTAPTFSDGWSYASAQFNNNSIAVVHRDGLSLSSRGDFYWFESLDTNGAMYSVLGVTKLVGGHSADLYQTVSMFAGAGISNSTGFLSTGTVNTAIVGSSNAILKGRNFSGSGLPTIAAIFPGYSTGAAANILTIGSNTAANASDTTYTGFPIYLMDITNTDLKGRVADLLWASGAAAQGANVPNTTPYDYAKFGHIFFPWVSTSSPLI